VQRNQAKRECQASQALSVGRPEKGTHAPFIAATVSKGDMYRWHRNSLDTVQNRLNLSRDVMGAYSSARSLPTVKTAFFSSLQKTITCYCPTEGRCMKAGCAWVVAWTATRDDEARARATTAPANYDATYVRCLLAIVQNFCQSLPEGKVHGVNWLTSHHDAGKTRVAVLLNSHPRLRLVVHADFKRIHGGISSTVCADLASKGSTPFWFTDTVSQWQGSNSPPEKRINEATRHCVEVRAAWLCWSMICSMDRSKSRKITLSAVCDHEGAYAHLMQGSFSRLTPTWPSG
jgi:hypothetical protein